MNEMNEMALPASPTALERPHLDPGLDGELPELRVSEGMPSLLRKQHEELVRRLDFQDELLRVIIAGRKALQPASAGAAAKPELSPRERRPSVVSPQKTPPVTLSYDKSKMTQQNATLKEHLKRTYTSGSPKAEPSEWRVRLQGMVHHPIFETVMAFVVITNAVFIGVDVQRSVTYPGTRAVEFRVIQYIYASIFTMELLLRVLADGLKLFYKEDWAWSWLDLFIVATSLWEVVVDVSGANELESIGGVSGLKSFRIIRLSRILRTAQFVGIFRFVIALRMLVTSILHTLKALVWAMTLLLLIVYVFAVVFTQAVNDYIHNPESPSLSARELEAAGQYFGSLLRSMLTLFMSLAGGLSWEQAINPLEAISPVWVLCYVFYISFTYFAVLNVVTAVFCQSAIESAQNDQVTLMQNMLMNKEKHVTKIQELFGKLGADDEGFITLSMFEENINSEAVRTYFEALGLDVWDAWSFFKLLDSDGGGSVDVEEFFMGCLRFRGQARAMDVGQLIQDQSGLIKSSGRFQAFMEAEMGLVKRDMQNLMQLCSRRGSGSEWSPRNWKEK